MNKKMVLFLAIILCACGIGKIQKGRNGHGKSPVEDEGPFLREDLLGDTSFGEGKVRPVPDSVANWLREYGLRGTEDEAYFFSEMFGGDFFRLSQKIVSNRLVKENAQSACRIEDSLLDENHWIKRIDLFRAKYPDSILHRLYNNKDPMDYVWKPFKLVLPGYEYCDTTLFRDNIKATSALRKIFLIKGTWDTITKKMPLNPEVSLWKTRLEVLNIRTDGARCRLLFYLWHRLYSLGQIDSARRIYNNMDWIVRNSQQFDTLQEVNWETALLKMQLSMSLTRWGTGIDLTAPGRISRMRELLGSMDKNNKTVKRKTYDVSVLWAFIESYLPGKATKLSAVIDLQEAYGTIAGDLTFKDRGQFYAIRTRLLENYLLCENFDKRISISYTLPIYYRLSLSSDWISVEDNMFMYKARNDYFNLYEDWKSQLCCSYDMLGYVLDNPCPFSFQFINEIIGNIQFCHLQLKNKKRFNVWSESIHSPFRGEHYRGQLKSGVEDLTVLDNVVFKLTTLDPLPTKFPDEQQKVRLENIYRKYTNHFEKKRKWKWAYRALQKADSIEVLYNNQHNPYFAYHLVGESMQSEKDGLIQEKLEGQNEELSHEKSRLEGNNDSLKIQIVSRLGQMKQLQDSISLQRRKLMEVELQVRIERQKLDSAQQAFSALASNYTDTLNRRKKQLKDTTERLGTIQQLAVSEGHLREEAEYNLTISNIFLSVAIIAILAVLFLAWKFFTQRKKAELERLLHEYKSRIWQEFGHVPLTAIGDTYEKLSESGTAPSNLTSINILYKFLQGLFGGLNTDRESQGVELRNEIDLAKQYILHTNSVLNKDIEFETVGEVPDMEVPPAIILSCIRNAVNHGELKKIGNGKIAIRVDRMDRDYQIHILDNGKGFKKEITTIKSITSGTGLKNADAILRYFCEFSKRYIPVHFGRANEPGFSTDLTLTIIKK